MNSTFELYNMYREVDILSLLNKLFATLLSEKLNVNNYLTNIKVEKMYYIKDTLHDLDYLLDDSLDKVKTLIKIKKGYPIFKLDEIELISIIKTKVSTEYREGVVIENLKLEINSISNLIKEIIRKLDVSNNEVTSILNNVDYEFQKIELDLI